MILWTTVDAMPKTGNWVETQKNKIVIYFLFKSKTPQFKVTIFLCETVLQFEIFFRETFE